MVLFLTSSPCIPGTPHLNPLNGLVDGLLHFTHHVANAVYITSDPDNKAFTDGFGYGMKDSLEEIGIHLRSFALLDGQNDEKAEKLIKKSNLVILCGGHVPTQNQFFQRIHLKEIMKNYNGIVLGISAGSMNCADWVYAHPELDGEATDPNYQRFIRGLGLTKCQILPHFQEIKDNVLDGKRIMEDIAFHDSYGRRFFCLPDGSYIFSRGEGHEEIRGEAWVISEGKIAKICENGKIYKL
ncbi:MAG: Type 1 glutamine amidotransferase-like domain-containing protein [Bacteroidaceae bacterium]|nr:Type 1 glutamine amidotransferase-like domain-containing protein [Bacteroidaceae bacterium]